MLCAVAASNTCGVQWVALGLGLVDDEEIAHTLASYQLAAKAFDEAYKHPCTKFGPAPHDFQNWPAQMAEAESMLRCGWSPEDGGTP